MTIPKDELSRKDEIGKAKELIKEMKELELSEDDLKEVAGGWSCVTLPGGREVGVPCVKGMTVSQA